MKLEEINNFVHFNMCLACLGQSGAYVTNES
jgi:hypothetical protein